MDGAMAMPSDRVAVNHLLAAIPNDVRARVAPFMEEIELTSRLELCSAGSPIAAVVFPIDAVTSTLMEMAEGDSVEVGLSGVEGLVGLDLLYGLRDSLTTVIVQVPGRGVRLDADTFRRELLQDSAARGVMLRYARGFLGMVAQTAACNASHAIEERLARWLLMVHDRVQRNHFPLTHEFISLMLGVRRASVTQAASMLRSAGAIDYQRGDINVLDRAALEGCACSCYVVVRRLADSLSYEEHTARVGDETGVRSS